MSEEEAAIHATVSIWERPVMNFLLLAAAAAQTFNLNCTGTYDNDNYRTEPFSHVYRIDLSRKKWCVGECRRLDDFIEIGPTHFTFEKYEKMTPWQAESRIRTVDRETGKYFAQFIVQYKEDGRVRDEWNGQCERLPFTGFPSFNTKF
jgi:hypothetical protein